MAANKDTIFQKGRCATLLRSEDKVLRLSSKSHSIAVLWPVPNDTQCDKSYVGLRVCERLARIIVVV